MPELLPVSTTFILGSKSVKYLHHPPLSVRFKLFTEQSDCTLIITRTHTLANPNPAQQCQDVKTWTFVIPSSELFITTFKKSSLMFILIMKNIYISLGCRVAGCISPFHDTRKGYRSCVQSKQRRNLKPFHRALFKYSLLIKQSVGTSHANRNV